MKRSSVLSFFHSVVAVLVMTISATSAHADPNKGCELQSDYDAVLNGVAGLARSAKRAGMSEAAISQKRERLADLANEKYRACVVAETDLLVKAHEWVDLAPGKCAQKEDEAIAAVNALVKKQIQDPVTGKLLDCYPDYLAIEFEKVIKTARVKRGMFYGHGVER